MRRLSFACIQVASVSLTFASLAIAVYAADDAPGPKPVPLMQVLPLPNQQASFERDGHELTRYHFGAGLRRPFLYPLIGAAGRSVTRMGHPHDPESHSHHNSVWISHHDVGGVNFWADRGKNMGRIVHQRVERYDDADVGASMLTVNAWKNEADQTLLEERRRVEVEPLADGQWRLTIDLMLSAKGEPLTLGKTPFGLLGVRMAKTIGVHDGGGKIRNSAGQVNEKEVLWKQAKWVDYSGPIVADVLAGVTLMDHPSNPNHPSYFHVRDDGWMCASLTYDAPRVIEVDAPLRLRYRLYVHRGAPALEELASEWQAFADSAAPDISPAKKKT
jgi:hypothetical protein